MDPVWAHVSFRLVCAIGVDVSKERLCVCRKLAVKYELGRGPTSETSAESAAGAPLRLVLVEADGRRFSSEGVVDAKQVVFDSKAYDWQVRPSLIDKIVDYMMQTEGTES